MQTLSLQTKETGAISTGSARSLQNWGREVSFVPAQRLLPSTVASRGCIMVVGPRGDVLGQGHAPVHQSLGPVLSPFFQQHFSGMYLMLVSSVCPDMVGGGN